MVRSVRDSISVLAGGMGIPHRGLRGLDKYISISLYGYVLDHIGYAQVKHNIVML